MDTILEETAWETMRNVVVAYNLSCELASELGLDDVVTGMAPGSDLRRFYRLVCKADGGSVFGSDRAWSKIRQFDLAGVSRAMADITRLLSKRVEWHA